MSKPGKIFFALALLSVLALGVGRFILQDWIPFFWVLLGLCGLFIGVAIFVDRKFFSEFFSMKTTKHGLNMGALIILVIAFLGIINFLGVRKSKTWDFSQAQRNTLSDQSVKIIKSLQDELRVSFFYQKGAQQADENRREFRELIKKYQDQSDKVKLDFFEANEHLDKANEYGVTKGSGIAFVEYKGKRNRIDQIKEEEITQAIIKVTRDKNKVVYFSAGHGESDVSDSKEPEGVSLFKLMVENNSFEVKSFNLPTQPKVPDDADLVLVIGPKQNFLEHEVNALLDYLKRGGNLILALEPGRVSGLERVLASAGIEAENNFIKSSFMGLGYIDGPAMGSAYSSESEITKVFSRAQDVTRFQWPMNLKTTSPPSGITQDILVKTSKQASAFSRPAVESGGDVKEGPFNLAVLAKGKWAGGEKDGKLLVFGDSEFLGNALLYQGLNRDLALNSVSSLVGEDSLVSIAPRQLEKTVVNVTTASKSFFVFGFILPLPILLLILALGLWFRRRNA